LKKEKFMLWTATEFYGEKKSVHLTPLKAAPLKWHSLCEALFLHIILCVLYIMDGHYLSRIP
jgi:hypothetical protein